MSETIVIEAVSDKFKNKYSSGSVLVGGKWYQVSPKLNLSNFKKDKEVTVEIQTNNKGYSSITEIVNLPGVAEVEDSAKLISKYRKIDSKEIKPSYEDNKNRKILVQGITQAVVQSPLLAGLPFTNSDEAIKLVKEVSLSLIEFVDEESSK